MNSSLFQQIDSHFIPWAQSHGLLVYTQAKDEETRAVLPVDKFGNEFEIWAIPVPESACTEVTVGAALLRRGNKKHTFFRERRNYYFSTSVPLSETGAALSEAWNAVQAWEEAFSKSGNA